MRLIRATRTRLIVFVCALAVVAWANGDLETIGVSGWQSYGVRIINLCAINAVLAMSLNLVNGFTGQFSLPRRLHGGWRLYNGPSYHECCRQGESVLHDPHSRTLRNLTIPFLPALVFAGLLRGVVASGWRACPSPERRLSWNRHVRVRRDNPPYHPERVRKVTNGALGLKESHP